MVKLDNNKYKLEIINDGFPIKVIKNKEGKELLCTTANDIIQVNEQILVVFDNLVVPPVFEQYKLGEEIELVKEFDCSHVKGYCDNEIWVLFNLETNKSTVYNVLSEQSILLDNVFDVYKIDFEEDKLCLLQDIDLERDNKVISDTFGIVVDRITLRPIRIYSGCLKMDIMVNSLEELEIARNYMIDLLFKKRKTLALRHRHQSLYTSIY